MTLAAQIAVGLFLAAGVAGWFLWALSVCAPKRIRPMWLRRLVCQHPQCMSSVDVIFVNGKNWHRCRSRRCMACGASQPHMCPPESVLAGASDDTEEVPFIRHGNDGGYLS